MRVATVCFLAFSLVACSDSRQKNLGPHVAVVETSVLDFQTKVQEGGTFGLLMRRSGATIPREFLAYVEGNATLERPGVARQPAVVQSRDFSQDFLVDSAFPQPAELLFEMQSIPSVDWTTMSFAFPEAIEWQGLMRDRVTVHFRSGSSPVVQAMLVYENAFDLWFSEPVEGDLSGIVILDGARQLECRTDWGGDHLSVYVDCGSALPPTLRVVIAEESLKAGDVVVKSVAGAPFDETLSLVELPRRTFDDVRVWSPAVN